MNVLYFNRLIVDLAVKVFPVVSDLLNPEMLDLVAIDESFLDLKDRVTVLLRAQRGHKEAKCALRIFDRAIHLVVVVRNFRVSWTSDTGGRAFLFRRPHAAGQ